MASNIKLMNANGKLLTIVNGDGNTSDITIDGGQIVKQIDTILDLRLMAETPSTIYVTGYHTANDGAFGSHFFKWNSTSVEADNSGTVIKLFGTTTGRYELQYSGSVNVKWFGAKGDGAADDTNAIKYVLETFTNVYIPTGTYLVTQDIVAIARISIIGGGRERCFLINNTTTGSFITLQGNSNYLFGVYIRADLGTALSLPDSNGQEGVYENSTFKGLIAVHMNGSWNNKFINCRLRAVSGGIGLKTTATGAGANYDTLLYGCSILGDSSSSTTLCQIDSGSITFDGCDLEGAGHAFKHGSGVVDHLHVINCHFEALDAITDSSSFDKFTGNLVVADTFNSSASAIRVSRFTNNVFAHASDTIPFNNVEIYTYEDNNVYTGGTRRVLGLSPTKYRSRPIATLNLIKTMKRTHDGKLFGGIANFYTLPTITTANQGMLGSVATLTGSGTGTNGIQISVAGCDSILKFLIAEHTGSNLTIGFEVRKKSDNATVGGYSCTLKATDTSGSIFYEVFTRLKDIKDFETYSKIYIYWDNSLATTFKIANFALSQSIGFGINTSPDSEFTDDMPPSGSGEWSIGDKVYNDSPAPASFIGWVCTTAGTPGTWKTFGTIST